MLSPGARDGWKHILILIVSTPFSQLAQMFIIHCRWMLC